MTVKWLYPLGGNRHEKKAHGFLGRLRRSLCGKQRRFTTRFTRRSTAYDQACESDERCKKCIGARPR